MTRARDQLRHEPVERRVRASLGARPIADSTRAMLVWEPRRDLPVLRRAGRGHPRRAGRGAAHQRPRGRHAASRDPVRRPHRRRRAGHGRRARGRRVPARRRGPRRLRGARLRRVRLARGGRADPRPPARSVPPRRRAPAAARPVRIELDGEVLAETTRARLLCETNLPMRFYVPREDVRAELRPELVAQLLPVQGRSVVVVGRRARGPRLELRAAAADVAPITGLRRVLGRAPSTCIIDGSAARRPDSVFSKVAAGRVRRLRTDQG